MSYSQNYINNIRKFMGEYMSKYKKILISTLLVLLSFAYGDSLTDMSLGSYEEIKIPSIVAASLKGKRMRVELGLSSEDYNEIINSAQNNEEPAFKGQAVMLNEKGDVLYQLLLDTSNMKYVDFYTENNRVEKILFKGFVVKKGAEGISSELIQPKRGTVILHFKIYKNKNINKDVNFFIKVTEVDYLK